MSRIMLVPTPSPVETPRGSQQNQRRSNFHGTRSKDPATSSYFEGGPVKLSRPSSRTGWPGPSISLNTNQSNDEHEADFTGFAAALLRRDYGPPSVNSGKGKQPAFPLSQMPSDASILAPTSSPGSSQSRKRSPPAIDFAIQTSKQTYDSNPFFATLNMPSVSGLNLTTSPLASPSIKAARRTPSDSPKSNSFPFTVNLASPSKSQTTSGQSSPFQAITSDALVSLLAETDAPETLVLDMRTHSAFASTSRGHLRSSINLCAPSTLLRRPNFTLGKLAAMLPDPAEEARFSNALMDAEQGFLKTLVVLDQDSTSLVVNNAVHSVLSKFSRAGFQGTLAWLHGGYNAICQHPRADIDYGAAQSRSSSTSDSDSMGFDIMRSRSHSSSESAGSSPATGPNDMSLKVQFLPMAAFDASSTQQHALSLPKTSLSPGPLAIRSKTVDETHSRLACNPFFDAIRQNAEGLSWHTSSNNLSPFDFSPTIDPLQKADDMPDFLHSFVSLTPKQRAVRAAKEFYDLECLEQKRLQRLMHWHANEQDFDNSSENPLSISAGVEKGHLNRYKHIFPFEHARCRINRNDSNNKCDYVNASHINFGGPLASKRYIASQAPPTAAIPDFWRLVLQQNVSVIVMLTELLEGGREKSSKYFAPGTYGDVTVELLHRDQPSPDQSSHAGFFGLADQVPLVQRRLLRITTKGLSRTVQHLQMAQWPDFGVPPTSETLLDMIDDTNKSNKEIAKANDIAAGPILVHCSAGVGRTGCFILVDVILHALRNKLHLPTSKESGMDIDMDDQSSTNQAMFAIVDQMRRQRMSMVANAAQYRYCYRAIVRGYHERVR